MNKSVRTFHNAQSRLSYDRPVYIEGYTPASWGKVILVLMLLVMLTLLVAYFLFHNENALTRLFAILWASSLVALFWGLIAPLHFSSKIISEDKEMSRKGVATLFGLLSILFFILIGITTPVKTESITTKTITETMPIHYSTTVQYNDKLPKGQTQTIKGGLDGIETYTYKVIYRNGKETSRSIEHKTLSPPISKVNSVGTYVAPITPAQTTPTSSSGYTNIDGNHIESPSDTPVGASAQCIDGTYSYSAHRQGTCSHHGGVASWL